MKAKLMLALLAAVVLGGCAIVPLGYDGYYQGRGYYGDRYYRSDRHFRDDDYRRDRWSDRTWGDGYSRGGYYRNWDRGQ